MSEGTRISGVNWYCTLSDWRKIPRILDSTWPQPLPPRRLYTHENIEDREDHETWWEQAWEAPYLCLDTEYGDRKPISQRVLRLVGLYYPGACWIYQCWWVEGDSGPAPRADFSHNLVAIVRYVPVVMFNAIADISALQAGLGIRYEDYYRVEDPMLAHAVLYSDLDHDFGFVQSLYGRYERVKHLQEEDELLYNAGDTVELEPMWEACQREFKTDPQSETIYREQSLPLIPILLESAARGIRTDQRQCDTLLTRARRLQTAASGLATACMGRPCNLASDDQVRDFCYGVRRYSPKTHYKTKHPTIDKAALAGLRLDLGPWYDAEEEERSGLDVAHARERITAGADGLLEARVIYQQCEANLKYLREMQAGRIYPDTAIHTQASGRHSTTDPPVAQYPDDIEDLLIPEEGEAIIEWDWKQLEPRILAYKSDDHPTMVAIERGDDIHTTNCQVAFGRCDKQLRKLTKSVIVLRSNYGGDPRGVGTHPTVRALGLSPSLVVAAAQRYNVAHPAKTVYWNKICEQIKTTKMTRTEHGRRRIAFRGGPDTQRALFNHLCQGEVSDIFNLTLIAIKRKLPLVRFLWGKHDAQHWACPEASVEAVFPMIQSIVEQPWRIGRYIVSFPAEYRIRRYQEVPRGTR